MQHADRRSRVGRVHLLALGVVMLVAAAWLGRYALKNASWENDEELYQHVARWVARDFPASLFQMANYQRGIQRLNDWLLAAPLGFTDSPWSFRISHLLFVAIYVSAAVPAFLMARALRVGEWAAVLVGGLVLLVPWVVITTSFLTDSLGYAAFCWFLWAAHRAIVSPTAGRELLALAVLVAAVLTRTGFLVLAPLLPLAAVLQSLRFGGVRPLACTMWARYRVLTVVLVAGVVVLVLDRLHALPGGGLQRFTGTYATTFAVSFVDVLKKTHTWLSRIAIGTAVIPFLLALAWYPRQLARPRDPGHFAFAVVGLLGCALVLFASINSPGDERYVAHLAIPVLVGGMAALLNREVGPRGVVLAGALTVLLVLTARWTATDAGAYQFFSYPVEAFWDRVLVLRLERTLPSVLSTELVVGAAMAVGTAAAAVAVSRRRIRVALPAVVVGVSGLALVMCGYTLHKFVYGAGNGAGPGIGARAWVDRAVPRGTAVGAVAVGRGAGVDYQPIWRDTQYWNQSMKDVITFTPTAAPFPMGTLAIDDTHIAPDGRILTKHPFPAYVTVPREGNNTVQLAGRIVAGSPNEPVDLMLVERPVWARWNLGNLRADGGLIPDSPADVLYYTHGAPARACTQIDLTMPANYDLPAGHMGYVVRSAGRRRTGLVRPGQTRRVVLPLRRAADGETFQRVFVTTTGKAADYQGTPITMVLQAVDLVACP